jgi:hypothetical protein
MRHWLCLAILVSACGDADMTDPPDPPSQAEIADARARIDAASDDVEQVRSALEKIGILPTYTCGEPQGGYVSRLSEALDGQYGCADLAVDGSDPARDVVIVTFPSEGCTIDGHVLTGTMTIAVAAGDDRFLLELDVTALGVDGRTAPVIASYEECGDETRYGAIANGEGWSLDVVVAKRDGIPVIGGTTLILDGTGMRNGDQLTLTGLEYEIGDLLPKAGRIVIQTATGHRIQATFTEASPVHLEVEVIIDAHDAVTIPIPA